MFLKNILVSFLLLCFYNFCFGQNHFVCGSMPAYPYPVNFTQADGSNLTILLKGDEFLNWAKTTDGFIILNNKNGTYEYAVKLPDGNLTTSGIQANNPENRKDNEKQFLNSVSKDIFFSKKQVQEAKNKRYLLNNNNLIQNAKFGNFPTTGTRKLLMILVNFNNTTPTFTQTQFYNYMNQAGYSYNGSAGSFKDYYLASSIGQLTVNTTVITWVTVPHPHNYYGPSAMWTHLVYDAVVACHNANPTLDFSTFQNTGGIMNGIAIIHQGTGQEASGNTNDVWSHSSDIRGDTSLPALTYNGITIGPYTTEPEKISNYMTTIGVMCHEFGHNLGLPDLYDTDYSSEGMGNWDLMAGGSWNHNGQCPPVHNVWSKLFLQWVHPTTLSSAANGTLNYSIQSADCYRVNTATGNEYFLLENRQQTSWDAYLPGHGMLIFHIDGSYINSHFANNTINDSDSHQGVDIVEADNVSTGSNGGDAGNPFPGTSHKYTFTDSSSPNSKSWAVTNTNKPITNIVENTSTKIITFSFMGGLANNIENPDETIQNGINIYPNPSNGIFNISINNNTSSQVNIKIYNILGTLVFEKNEFSVSNNFNTAINVSNFSKGIYIAVIKCSDSSKKIVKGKIIIE